MRRDDDWLPRRRPKINWTGMFWWTVVFSVVAIQVGALAIRVSGLD